MSRRALTQPGFRIRAADREQPSRRRSSRSALGRRSSSTADLPSLAADDLQALEAATPEPGIAIAAAADGTTNALGLSDMTLFAPLYGSGERRAIPWRTPSAPASRPSTSPVQGFGTTWTRWPTW